MSLTLDGSRVTLVINSTYVDDDTVQRIRNLLNDPDSFPPPQVSTTTVFQEIPTTVSVTVMQTSTVTATVAVVRTIAVVSAATFQPSTDRNQIVSPTPDSSSPVSTDSLPTTTTPFTSPTPLMSDLSPPDVSAATTATSSNVSASPSSTASASDSPPSGKKGLPAGGIIGIVLLCLVLCLFLVIVFVRWRLKRKRISCRAWITPFIGEKSVVRESVTQRQQKRMEFIAERWQRLRNSRGNRGGRGNKGASFSRDLEADPTPTPPAYPRPSARNPVQDDLVSSMFPHGAVAKIRFEPRKRDELSVHPGDYLKVLTMYNDGWSFCKNGSGGKGMVPTTCLRANRVGRMAQS